jgi:hypothetical protein
LNAQGAYATPAGVEAAIKQAANAASANDSSINVNERIRQEHFRRVLSRVFAGGERSEWLLKGGTGVLARVPSARATKDVDLYRAGYTLDQALDDLRQLVKVDLADHFRFEYVSHVNSLGGPGQAYVDGYTVRFDVYVGAQSRGQLKVDLSTGAGNTDNVSLIEPANALPLPRLTSTAYRVYPVVDQVADKICATHMLYSGSPSTRQKDLVDLVVFARTHDINGFALRTAIETEARRRGLATFNRVELPRTWGSEYSQMAKRVPHCEGFTEIKNARALIENFIEPALRGEVDAQVWMFERLAWE